MYNPDVVHNESPRYIVCESQFWIDPSTLWRHLKTFPVLQLFSLNALRSLLLKELIFWGEGKPQKALLVVTLLEQIITLVVWCLATSDLTSATIGRASQPASTRFSNYLQNQKCKACSCADWRNTYLMPYYCTISLYEQCRSFWWHSLE